MLLTKSVNPEKLIVLELILNKICPVEIKKTHNNPNSNLFIDIENLQLNGLLIKNGIAETERDNVNFLYSDELELIESKYENGKPISF